MAPTASRSTALTQSGAHIIANQQSEKLRPLESCSSSSALSKSSVQQLPEEDAIIVRTETHSEQRPEAEENPASEATADDFDGLRDAYCARLEGTPFLTHKHPLFQHGRAYDGPSKAPRTIWECKKPPRDDHSAPSWLTASEFEDEPEVARAKIQQLAQLIRLSQKTVLYTGAGISAAVVGQAARSGQNTVGWKGDTRKAAPTFTHHALGLLGRTGLIHSWVQQNHDGLPQKAGFPQERINEIHGSWYDPSNPVVKYSGSLHDRAYPWMEEDAETADLALVLGTSLGGLNADQVATKTAGRSLSGASLGTVCINLQQTEQDGKMSLRLFGKSDDLLRMLLQELGLLEGSSGIRGSSSPKLHFSWPKESRVLVPYDKEGRRSTPDQPRMWLDLRDDQKVRITPGHNIQGARQPQYMHIGAAKAVKIQGVERQPAPGLGSVLRREEDSGSFVLQIEQATMRLGIWWLEAAQRGAVDVLPIVNTRPAFETAADQEQPKKAVASGSSSSGVRAPRARRSVGDAVAMQDGRRRSSGRRISTTTQKTSST